jgi:SpoVK/Ycf46/Vps4 family AAA+-type ATPase
MRYLLNGHATVVRYKDADFNQIIDDLRHAPGSAQTTLIAFTGLPGMFMESAARELAAHMGKHLYRVDLKGVSDKYIGETEKNLNKVFDRTRVTGSILLFDEADDLFGKRTDVKDAHDRYANLETNYLLNLMEDHRGIIIGLFRSPIEAERRWPRLRHLVVKFPPA